MSNEALSRYLKPVIEKVITDELTKPGTGTNIDLQNIVKRIVMPEVKSKLNQESVESIIENMSDNDYHDTPKKETTNKLKDKSNVQEETIADKMREDPDYDLFETADKFKKPFSDRVLPDIILPVLGDTAKATGNIFSAKHALLGAALQAMADSQPKAKAELYGPTGLDRAAAIANPASQVKATMAKTLGDVASNRLYNIADTERSEQDLARMMAYQAEQPSNVGFWQAYNKATPAGNKKGSGGNLPSDK